MKNLLFCLLVFTVACGKNNTTTLQMVNEKSFDYLVKPYCFDASGDEAPCVEVNQDIGACGLVFTVGGESAYEHVSDGSARPIENGLYQRKYLERECFFTIQNENTWE